MSEYASDAPKKSERLSISEAYDADLHARNLTNWQQEYDQVSRGAFYGRITELPFEGLQVFCEHTSQALQQTCVVWPDSIWLGIPFAEQENCRINGLRVAANAIMCRPGDCEFQLSTPANYDLYGMVVDQSMLMTLAHIHGVELHWKELTEHGRLGLSGKTIKDVRFVLDRLLCKQPAATPQRLQKDIVMMALLEILKEETPQPAKAQSYHHRKSVVDMSRQFLQEHMDEAVTVTQLCEVANVSRRTLQYSFDSILGVSPIQYLRASRLNGVRRALVHAEQEASISHIAAQWGFWHLSQFAKDYKRLFGEQPSQTLGGEMR